MHCISDVTASTNVSVNDVICVCVRVKESKVHINDIISLTSLI